MVVIVVAEIQEAIAAEARRELRSPLRFFVSAFLAAALLSAVAAGPSGFLPLLR